MTSSIDFRALAEQQAGRFWSAFSEEARAVWVRAAKRDYLAERLVATPVDAYPEWIARQSAADQDRALGPKRGAAFRAGSLPIDRYTDPPLPPLSLEQLAATLGITITPAAADADRVDDPQPPQPIPGDDR